MADEEIPDFQSLGRDHARRVEHEQAVVAFREAIRRNAGGRTTYRDLGISLAALGRLADAEDAFSRAVEENPADASAFHQLGRVLLRQHLAEKALPFLQRAARIAPHKSAIQCDLAKTLQSLDRFDEAEDILRQALAVVPANARLLMEHARLLATVGRHKEAVPLFRYSVAIDPLASGAHRHLIKSLSLSGDFQGALTAAAAAVGHLPTESAHHHWHGRLLARAGRHGEAATALRRAVELDPKRPGALRDLGSALRVIGRHSEAAKSLSEAAALAPDDAGSRHELGRALASMGRYLEAVDAFRQALELDPGRRKARREMKAALSGLRHAGCIGQLGSPEWQENVDCSVALCFLREVTEADRLWLRAMDGLFAEAVAPAGPGEAAVPPAAPALRAVEGGWRACITASGTDWILPVAAGLPDRGLVEAMRRRAGAGIGVVCARSDGVDESFRLFRAAPLKACSESAGASASWDDCAAAAAAVLRHRFLETRKDPPLPIVSQGEAWLVLSSVVGAEATPDRLRELDGLQAAYRRLGFQPVAVRLMEEATGEPAWPSVAGAADAFRRAAILRRPRAVHVFSEAVADALDGLQGLDIPLLHHHHFEEQTEEQTAATTPQEGRPAQPDRLFRRADVASCASGALRDALERRSGAILAVLDLTGGGEDERVQALDGLLKRAARRVAVAVGGGIGNMIQCSPAIRKLSEHYGCPVDVVLKQDFPGCGWLFAGAPWVGSVFPQTDAAAEMRFDVLFVFDSFGEVLPAFNAERLLISRHSYPFSLTQKMHEADFNLMCVRGLLGIPYVAADLPRYFVGRQVDRARIAGRVGLHAGCKSGIWEAKRWPHFAELAQRLTSAGFEVVSFGGPGEAVDGTKDRTGTSLRDTVENMRECSYFIANDSGLMHVADALNIPTTALFGPSSAVKNGPLAPTSQIVALEKSCAPCQFRRAEFASCRCMGELPPDAVWQGISTHMARSGIGAALCDAPSENCHEGPWAPLVVFSALADGDMPALPPGAMVISGGWPHADGFPCLAWLHEMLPDRRRALLLEQEEAGYVFLSPQLAYTFEYLRDLSRHLARGKGRDIAYRGVVYDPLSMAFDHATDGAEEAIAALVTLGCFRAGTLLSADKADKRGALRLVTASEPFLVVDARSEHPARISRLRQAIEAQPLSDAEHQLGFEAAARAHGLGRSTDRMPSWRDGSLQTTQGPVQCVDAEAAKRLVINLLERPRELVASSREEFAGCLEAVAAFGLHGAFTEIVQTHHATVMERHPELVGEILACVALVLEPEALGRLLLSAARPVLRGASPHPVHLLVEAARKFCPPAVLGDLLQLIDASAHAEYLRQDTVMEAVGDRLSSASSPTFLLPRTQISHADFLARTSGGNEILRAVRARDRTTFITQVNLFLERGGGTFPLSLMLRTFTQDVAALRVGGQIRYARSDPERDTLALAVILGDAVAAAPQLDSGALAPTDPLVVAWRSRTGDFRPLNAVLGGWLSEAGAQPVRLEGACRLELFRTAYAGHALPDAADRGTVSIVMAAHNPEAKLMRLAVESVLAQTYRHLELIIVDDGSDADQAAAIQELAVLDSRIRFLRSERSHGPYHCRNMALDIARGVFVAFHDDDDVAHPQRLDLQLSALVEAPTRQVCFSMHMRFDSAGAIQFEVNPDRLNLRGDGPVTSVYRRRALETLGRFAQVRSRGDIEMRSRVEACYGSHAICYVEAPLMYCAGDSNSLSNTTIALYGDYVALFRQGFSKRVMPPILNGRFVQPPMGRLPIPHVLRSTFDNR